MQFDRANHRFTLSWSGVLALVGILALGGLAVRAATLGVADLYVKRSRDAMAGWAKSKAGPEQQEWAAVQSDLLFAHLLSQRDPNNLEDLGRLYYWRGSRAGTPTPDAVASRKQALDFFREAVKLRPTSPYTWTNIALAKLRLGQIDAEFNRALEQSVNLGPWEPEIQVAVVDIGLAAWPALPVDSRALVLQTLKRGAGRQAAQIWHVVQTHGRRELICNNITGVKESLPTEWCK